ncbi:LtfC-like domain-containing protein [Nocardia sp. NPDC004278]
MPDYLGYRPNRCTLVLSRGAAFIQRFETVDRLPNGTTSWIDFFDIDDELLTTWNATTVSEFAVEYLIEPSRIDAISAGTRTNYDLYLNYPGNQLPYCWFRGPIVREQ